MTSAPPAFESDMALYGVRADDLEWDEYTNCKGRFRAALTDHAGLRHTRANLIRPELAAAGPRHVIDRAV
jgi:hypothetical protein